MHLFSWDHVSFDAELAPKLVGELFDEVEVRRWDGPPLELPTRAAVRDYPAGRGVEPTRGLLEAAEVTLPMTVTKRGALVFARRL